MNVDHSRLQGEIGREARRHRAAARRCKSPRGIPTATICIFISTRDFNPVYDALQFDLSFPLAMRPFVVALRKDVPLAVRSKTDAPASRASTRRRDRQEAASRQQIEIDFDGIDGRVSRFPVEEGELRSISSRFASACSSRASRSKRIKVPTQDAGATKIRSSATLLAYDFDQQRLATLAHGGRSRSGLAADYRTLVYSSQRSSAGDRCGRRSARRRRRQKPAGSEPGTHSGWIDLARISVARRTARRVGADVARSVAFTARTFLGRADVGRRLGSSSTNATRAFCRAFARAASSPISFGRCKASSERRTRTRSAATIATLRISSAVFSAAT